MEQAPKLTLVYTILPSWAVPAVRNQMGKERYVLYVHWLYREPLHVFPTFFSPLPLPSFLLSLFLSLPSIIPPSLSLSFPLLLFLPPDLPSPLFLRRPLMQPCQHWIAYWNQRDQKGVWINEIGSHIGLFTAPYCCLECRKAGIPWYPFSREHDIIGKWENFSELTGNILFKRLHAKHSVCMTVAPQ